MEITISNRIELQDIPPALRRDLIDQLSFENPKWLEAKKMGRWLGKIEEFLTSYESTKDGLVIPRGFARQLFYLCKRYGVSYELIDQRRALPEVDFQFQGSLRPFQKQAVGNILRRDFGCLSSPTASGKTCMALFCIAERKQPALIVVHTKELLNQWVDRVESFLGIPADQVGIIGNGKRTLGDRITIATVQSLYKRTEEVLPHIGFLIVDEAHRCPSRTFTEAVTAFDSEYTLGLSATLYRRDGLSRLIYWYLGDTAHEVKKEDLLQSGDIVHAEVVVRQTNFTTRLDPSSQYPKMLSELTQDPERNALIASDVAREAKNDAGIPLILSDRKAHCETLMGLLKRHGVEAELLTGSVSPDARARVIERLNRGTVRVLIATGQLIGEGFDFQQLSTLFLATPIRFSGRVIQYLGRILRPAPGKKQATVYDYCDARVGVLKASFKARQQTYNREFDHGQSNYL